MVEKGLILYTDESLRGKGGFVGYVCMNIYIREAHVRRSELTYFAR